MSDMGWRADGISRARACGGVDLEVYRRPGFVNTLGVRRAVDNPASGSGFEIEGDYPDDFDPTPEEFARRHR